MNAANQQAYAVALALTAREVEAKATRKRFEAAHDAWRKAVGLPETVVLKSGNAVFEGWDGTLLSGRRT